MLILKQLQEDFKVLIFSLVMIIHLKFQALICIIYIILLSLKNLIKKSQVSLDQRISNLVNTQWFSKVYQEQPMIRKTFLMKKYKEIFRKVASYLVMVQRCITQHIMLLVNQLKKEVIDLLNKCQIKVSCLQLKWEEDDFQERHNFRLHILKSSLIQGILKNLQKKQRDLKQITLTFANSQICQDNI